MVQLLPAVFQQPGIVAGTWKAARRHDASIMDADTLSALRQLDPLRGEISPAEQALVLALLVEWVDVGLGGLHI